MRKALATPPKRRARAEPTKVPAMASELNQMSTHDPGRRRASHLNADARCKCLMVTPAGYSVFERSVERFAVHENASKYKVRASVLIQSEPIRPWWSDSNTRIPLQRSPVRMLESKDHQQI